MKNNVLIILTLLPSLMIGQSAERSVIGSAGSFESAGGLSHSYSVGEMVVFTGNSSNLKITQGFQQPDQMSVGIEEDQMGYSVVAFPNPTRGEVILDISAENPVQLNIDLYNLQGKQFSLPQRLISVAGNLRHNIDLSNMAAGSYFIRITDKDGKTNNSIQIQKVN
jgi:hypothetical protein